MAKRFHIPPDMSGEVISKIAPTPTAGVTVTESAKVDNTIVLTLAAKAVSVASGDDFGSVELLTLPNRNLLIVACVVDLAATVAGLATETVETVDYAIGTVATASKTFANAGEDNLTPKIDGVGAAAAGTVKGASSSATINVHIAAGASNKVFLNVGTEVTADTGTVTVTGTITLVIRDLGVPAA
jgi:hypothetical protein